MGLDIYLYRYDISQELAAEQDKAWEKISSELFDRHYAYAKREGRECLNDAERKTWMAEEKETALRSGRLESGDNPAVVRIKQDSAEYPKHLFKLGYFRSSYNSGGINSILDNRIGEDLYSILGLDQDEYVQQPDWSSALARVNEAIVHFKAFVAKNPYSLIDVGPNPFDTEFPKDERAILALVEKEFSKEDTLDFKEYSNRHGYWCKTGITVVGAVNGLGSFNKPTTYLVVKREGAEDGFEWYIEALSVVRETLEWVLKQENPEKYFLHVSG